jgi:hypothetical protein
MACNEATSLLYVSVYATQPSILGSQGIELTLQAGDAVTERGEASVHDELPSLKEWLLRAAGCAGCRVCSGEVNGGPGVAAD